MAMSAWTAWRTTALPERRVAGTVSDAGPAAGRLASTRSMTRRFSICSRSAPVASRAQRSHGTCWSSVSASATSPTRSSRSSVLITHPASLRAATGRRGSRPAVGGAPVRGPSRRRTEATPRPARGQRRRLFSSYDVYRAQTGRWPLGWGVGEVDGTAGTLPPGGGRHERAEPNQGALERLARRVGSRQTFDGRELRVVVPQFRPADDQPAIADRQARQALPVPPPQLLLQALLILRRRILEGPQGCLRRGEVGDVQTADDPAQLVLGRGSPRRAGDRRARR